VVTGIFNPQFNETNKEFSRTQNYSKRDTEHTRTEIITKWRLLVHLVYACLHAEAHTIERILFIRKLKNRNYVKKCYENEQTFVVKTEP